MGLDDFKKDVILTSKNRFLTREEASELVRNNNQEMVVDRSAIREQLYSEDLY